MFKKFLFFIFLIASGVICGLLGIKWIADTADVVTIIFISLLKTISMPLVFTAIVSAISSINNLAQVKTMFFKAMQYVITLTFLSALMAFLVFSVSSHFITGQKFDIKLTDETGVIMEKATKVATEKMTFKKYIANTVPSNFVKPFAEGNMLSVLIITILFSIAILFITEEQRKTVNNLFSAMSAIVFNIVKIILKIMPFAIWAFSVKMAADFKSLGTITDVLIYVASILTANLLQALVIIPIFLKIKGVQVKKLFKNVTAGLSVAFMAKSSGASMPINIKSFEENIAKKECGITRFLFPICTPLNMNSSSAFVTITILFLTQYYGIEYSLINKISLLFISTFVVMGNSTIPMATFILTTSFLANLNIPTEMMGIILPFYAMIDPFEATLNAWSDCAVVAAVKKEIEPDCVDL